MKELNCQEVALFSADILNSDCLLSVSWQCLCASCDDWASETSVAKFWEVFQILASLSKLSNHFEEKKSTWKFQQEVFIFLTLFLTFYWVTTRRCFETGK